MQESKPTHAEAAKGPASGTPQTTTEPAPDFPARRQLLAPATGLVDRVRDYLTGRGRGR